jgi:hypothetical protein
MQNPAPPLQGLIVFEIQPRVPAALRPSPMKIRGKAIWDFANLAPNQLISRTAT